MFWSRQHWGSVVQRINGLYTMVFSTIFRTSLQTSLGRCSLHFTSINTAPFLSSTQYKQFYSLQILPETFALASLYGCKQGIVVIHGCMRLWMCVRVRVSLATCVCHKASPKHCGWIDGWLHSFQVLFRREVLFSVPYSQLWRRNKCIGVSRVVTWSSRDRHHSKSAKVNPVRKTFFFVCTRFVRQWVEISKVFTIY